MMIVLALLLSTAAADPEIVSVTEGEPAPFTGSILNAEAAAKILVDTDIRLEQCRLQSERDLALQEANLNFTIRNKEAALAACTLRSTELEALRMEHIQFLERQVVRPKWEPVVYFIAGTVAGALTIYGSSVVLNNIDR